MKKIPFEYFEEGQTIYLDVQRLEELEISTGKSIGDIINSTMSIGILVSMLMVGMKQHYLKKGRQFYYGKIDECVSDGGSIVEMWKTAIKALLASGILGTEVADAVVRGKEIETDEKND